ncbi:MAG: methylenetetrahydrofolate reductase [Proteobacteria bacterium]|nr:methylenetetrahydrofolate reductase [Pseudomonadota bacterium]
MTRISVELVPRSEAAIAADLELLTRDFPELETVNIPDLLRFPLRSFDACALAKTRLPHAIPHLRAMDFDPERPFPLAEVFAREGFDEVIVVQGDAPQDLARRVFPTRSSDLVRIIKRDCPGATVYTAFDPYRSGLRAELEHARAKLDAGADGFFTQPFFDLRWMEICAEVLAGCRVYWGISPVLGARTRRYWETKNRAWFPGDFESTWEWNAAFGARALAWARERGDGVYFMPIRADLGRYLRGVLGP